MISLVLHDQADKKAKPFYLPRKRGCSLPSLFGLFTGEAALICKLLNLTFWIID